MRNQSLHSLAAFLGIRVSEDVQIFGYQIDSRSISPGDLFFALEGQKQDGHVFLSEVRHKGALAALVSPHYRGPDYGLILIPVEDRPLALQTLARELLKKTPQVNVVAVTGSVGKTTAKEFIATLLEGKFQVGKNPLSQNSKLTLPLTILNRTGQEEILVLEMGMSEPGDISRLVAIAPPDVAVLTKIGSSHIGQFSGGISDIAREKGAIFSHPKTKRGIVDHDFLSFQLHLDCPMTSFSLEDPRADYFLSVADGVCRVDERGVRGCRFLSPFQERHILHNILAAICVARELGVEWSDIEERISLLTIPKMRFEKVEKKGVFIINDAYNASPESLRAALMSLPQPKPGRKRVAVLGAMRELGALSAPMHREIGLFAQDCIDHLLVLGEEAAPLCVAFREGKKPAELFLDHQSLSIRLKELVEEGDVVLLKGSRASAMETILEGL